MITLVIVGVVAALTVPTLIAKYQEQQTVVAVKKFYSEISQAYNAAIAKNGPPDTWEWIQSAQGIGAENIMNIIAPHLRIMKRCGTGGTNDLCFGDVTYKSLNPSVNYTNISRDGALSAARLDNGFIFWIWAGDGCNSVSGTSKNLQHKCGQVGVDINGYKKPNQLGKDTFYFNLTKYNVIPMGTKEDTVYNIDNYCNRNNNHKKNGYACSAWIIEKGNMDYLHQDVSW